MKQNMKEIDREQELIAQKKERRISRKSNLVNKVLFVLFMPDWFRHFEFCNFAAENESHYIPV